MSMTAINDPAARPPRRGCAPLGIAKLPRLRGNQATELDGPVALSKRRHGVMIRVVPRKFVGRAALKMQLQLALLRFGNDHRVLRQGEPGAVLSAGLR